MSLLNIFCLGNFDYKKKNKKQKFTEDKDKKSQNNISFNIIICGVAFPVVHKYSLDKDCVTGFNYLVRDYVCSKYSVHEAPSA